MLNHSTKQGLSFQCMRVDRFPISENQQYLCGEHISTNVSSTKLCKVYMPNFVLIKTKTNLALHLLVLVWERFI